MLVIRTNYAQNQKSSCAVNTVPLNGGTIGASGTWNLIFSDEFNAPTLDRSKWDTRAPYSGDDNARIQKNQIMLDGDVQIVNGSLSLKCNKETTNFTVLDAPVHTTATRDFNAGMVYGRLKGIAYGKFEISCQLPNAGHGIWPGFWLMSTNPAGDNVREIDIFEYVSGTPDKTYTNIRKWAPNSTVECDQSITESPGYNLTDHSHIYTLEWDPASLRFYIDGVLVREKSKYYDRYGQPQYGSTIAQGDYFIDPLFPTDPQAIIIGTGVSLNTSDPSQGFKNDYVNSGTIFPNYVTVDYVRVYQRNAPATYADDVCENMIGGNNLICSNTPTTYEYLDAATVGAEWSVSDNLTIVSSTPTTVTVQPVSASTSGFAYIFIKKVNGNTKCPLRNSFSKKIWIGIPPVPTVTSLNNNCDPLLEFRAEIPTSYYYPLVPTMNWTIKSKSYSGGIVDYMGTSGSNTSIPYTLVTSNACGSNTKTGYGYFKCNSGGGLRTTDIKSTGTSDEETELDKRIQFFPSPSNGPVSFQLSSKLEGLKKLDHIVVYDIAGGKVKELNFSDDESNKIIDLSKENSGIYFIHSYFKDKKQEVDRVVINK